MLSLAVYSPRLAYPSRKDSRGPRPHRPAPRPAPRRPPLARRHGAEMVASAGDILYEEGAPAEHMVLILKGEISCGAASTADPWPCSSAAPDK